MNCAALVLKVAKVHRMMINRKYINITKAFEQFFYIFFVVEIIHLQALVKRSPKICQLKSNRPFKFYLTTKLTSISCRFISERIILILCTPLLNVQCRKIRKPIRYDSFVLGLDVPSPLRYDDGDIYTRLWYTDKIISIQ